MSKLGSYRSRYDVFITINKHDWTTRQETVKGLNYKQMTSMVNEWLSPKFELQVVEVVVKRYFVTVKRKSKGK